MFVFIVHSCESSSETEVKNDESLNLPAIFPLYKTSIQKQVSHFQGTKIFKSYQLNLFFFLLSLNVKMLIPCH